MTGLNLTPNEIVGYRVRPDYHNWTAVLVKVHGPQSRFAGQQYDTPIGYYKTLPMALRGIFELSTRLNAIELQEEVHRDTGELASQDVLTLAVERGRAAAEEAGRALEEQLQAAGLTVTDLAKALRTPEPADNPDEQANAN
jgi:hypothetical protein